MNTIELISRVARRARNGGDFTKLSLLERVDVLQAINGANQEVFNLLPAYFKEQTVGFTLPGPLAITGLVVTNGSKVVSGYAFTAEMIGRSIQISGDGSINQLIGAGTNLSLMNDYQGTTGTTTATIYGDAIYSTGFPFERIVGNPTFEDDRMWPMLRRNNMVGNGYTYPFFGMGLQLGRPQVWWVQNMGSSQGNVPQLVLRLFPMPDQIYGIRVRMSFWAKRLTLDDYDAASTITVLDQFIESALIPLAVRQFMLSPAWEPRRDDNLVLEAALRAEEFLRLQPGQVGAPANFVGTPPGF